jgi:hypothetical protein
MEVTKDIRGFEIIEHEVYPASRIRACLVQQASANGDYPDALSCSDTSFLWVGTCHRLSREDVRQLTAHLQAWLDTGSLMLIQPSKE